MDRSRLLALAPDYYTIAVCNFFSKPNNKIASSHTVWAGPGFKHWALYTHVLRTLVDKQMLSAIDDDFGPTIYSRTDSFDQDWEALKKKAGSPYFKFALDPQRDVWLSSALEAVNKALDDHKIKAEDLTKPDAEWTPIPVERTDPKLQQVTAELDKTIAAVEADNGYNATLPEE
jgi:hypothetical protein